MIKFWVVALLFALASCKTAEWHYNKAIEKGLEIKPKTTTVTVYDTITKDSIVVREIQVECPEVTPPKTRWRTRFDNKRFKDSLRHIRKVYSDSLWFELKSLRLRNSLLSDSLKQARKINSDNNRTERITARQENKRSLWWLWMAIGALLMLVILYLYRRFKKFLFI